LWTFFTQKHYTRAQPQEFLQQEFCGVSLSRGTLAEVIRVGNRDFGKESNLWILNKAMGFHKNIIFFLSRYFLKKGLGLKMLTCIQHAFFCVYNFLFDDIKKKTKRYGNLLFIFNLLRLNTNFFNINTFFFWLLRCITYNFFFKVTILPKFLKKKLKSKYSIEPVFLEKKKRVRAALRIFSLEVESSRTHLFSARLLSGVKDLAFNFKNSKFFLEKMSMYTKIFKLLKKKKKLC